MFNLAIIALLLGAAPTAQLHPQLPKQLPNPFELSHTIDLVDGDDIAKISIRFIGEGEAPSQSFSFQKNADGVWEVSAEVNKLESGWYRVILEATDYLEQRFELRDVGRFHFGPLPREPEVLFKTHNVIDSEVIAARAPRTLVDILRTLPQLDLRRRYDGGYDVVSAESQAPGSVLIFLDDLLLNDPYDGSVTLNVDAGHIAEVSVHDAADGCTTLPCGGSYVVRLKSANLKLSSRLLYGLELNPNTIQEAGYRARYHASVAGSDVLDGDGFRLSVSGQLAAHYSDGNPARVETDAYRDTPRPLSNTPGLVNDQHGGFRAGLGLRYETSKLVLNIGGATLYQRAGPYAGHLNVYNPVGLKEALRANLQLSLDAKLSQRLSFSLLARLQGAWLHRDFGLTPQNFKLSDRDGDGREEEFPNGVRHMRQRLALESHVILKTTVQLAERNDLILSLSYRGRHLAFDSVIQQSDELGTSSTDGISPNIQSLLGGPHDIALALSARHDVELSRILHLRWGLSYATEIVGAEQNNILGILPQAKLSARLSEALALSLRYGATFNQASRSLRDDQSFSALPEFLREGIFVATPSIGANTQHQVAFGGLGAHLFGEHQVSWSAEIDYAHLFSAIQAIPQDGRSDTYAQNDDIDRLGLALRLHYHWKKLIKVDARGNIARAFGPGYLKQSTPLWRVVLDVGSAPSPYVALQTTLLIEGARASEERSLFERQNAWRQNERADLRLQINSHQSFEHIVLGLNAEHLLIRQANTIPSGLLGDREGVPEEGLSVFFTLEYRP